MTQKHNFDKAHSDKVDRRPAGNSVYVAIAGEVVNQRSVHLRKFVLNGQASASNPLLHIHANRYMQLRPQLKKRRSLDHELRRKELSP
ncbi:MAG: hypothetical protein QW652_08100 [Candidatus Nitrosotenuis sp.]